MTTPNFTSCDAIRSRFSCELSRMYRAEVPQYGVLLDLVERVNEDALHRNARAREKGEQLRLDIERHGAIRVGTAAELATMRRLFAVMGMAPVGYYDLSIAGIPVHSTAFRPITHASLQRNPFRVFTSLLRLELIGDAAVRQRAADVLARRSIFTPQCLEFIRRFETRGGLTDSEATDFVEHALETFRWHGRSTTDIDTYHALREAHAVMADIVCFEGPHINHLTPRVLDIDAAQAAMRDQGLRTKALVEGSPRRRCPILLRQTSFIAMEEPVAFMGPVPSSGTQSARFGEIEERGVALTRKGRALYDRLLAEARADATTQDQAAALESAFAAFPDDLETLRRERLAFFRYALTEAGRAAMPLSDEPSIETMIDRGFMSAEPITYEDFLPVSAAGIFQSNLSDARRIQYAIKSAHESFEHALGCAVFDEIALYEVEQFESLRDVRVAVSSVEPAC
jgi:uncharacterized glyoxalase superfamily metalloenzyme YdcJ